jgi:ABC-type nitrate/sulfonate/bicarbonate transport system substrate-binding protein
VVAGSFTVWSTSNSATPPQTQVVFHLDSDFGSSLIRIAKAEGIFTNHGIDAKLTDYPTGADALDAMLKSPNSEIALASSAGVPFVALRPTTRSLKIITQLANNEDNFYWVVKKGLGNGTVKGLKGLRIGFPAVSGMRAFVEFSLQDHGVSKNDVTLVPMEPDDYAAAMKAGKIDAHPSRVLITEKTFAALAGNAYELHDVGALNFFEVLAASDQTIATHPKALAAVLSALLEAQTFSYNNVDIARAHIAESLAITVAEVPKNILDTANIRLSIGLFRQLTKVRKLLANDAGISESEYFENATELFHPDFLQEIDPLVVHLG